MPALNIINVSSIIGKTSVQAVSSTPTSIVSNPADSGKVLKINSFLVSNISDSQSSSITVDIYRNSTPYRFIKNGIIPIGGTLDLFSKTLYLEEGDSLRITASASNEVEAICSYEELS